MTQHKPVDPSATLFITPGSQCTGHVDGDGFAHAETPFVRSVGIGDLSQVVEHHINHIYGSVSHHVRFADGGHLNYIADSQGHVTEFFITGLDAVMMANGDITVWPRRPPA